MDMLALGAVGVVAALFAVMVRQRAPEMALELASLTEISPALLRPMLQTVGLALVTKLAAALCRDAGEGSLAAFVEVAGAAAAVLVALPLLKMVLQLVMGLL